MLHSFVDESKTPFYRLTAVLIRPADLSRLRQVSASWVMPGQRRVHVNGERNSRRGTILAQLVDMPVEAVIYEAADRVNEKAARDRCLTALATTWREMYVD